MNKKDIIVILITLVLIGCLFIIFSLNKKKGNYAIVTYKNNEILKIDLNIDKIYEVEGTNGKVIIEVNEKKIRVNEENSPYHYCSKQGYISNEGETIICLPNHIIIKIIGGNSIDTQVK